MPWDPIIDYRGMGYCTDCFMSIWKSLKPVICKVQGFAVGGGSDIALCCDIIVMEENALIGYPPARVWGCPTTAMWTYRVGMTWAKRILLTGDLLDGKTAERIGLVTKAVPANQLEAEVMKLANRMASVPKNQLAIQKMTINQVREAKILCPTHQVYEQAGITVTQQFATIMDGITRHTPEGMAFKKRMEEVGLRRAVRERDAGDNVIRSAKL